MQSMKVIFRYMFLMAIVAVVCSSCQKEIDEWNIDTQQTVTIELSVATAELTRAIPTDAEMNINSLRIYAFNGNKQAGYIYRGVTDVGTPFYMDLELPENGEYDVTFYLIANEGQMDYQNGAVALAEKMTIAQLEAITFTGLKSADALPMYCKTTEKINVDSYLQEPNHSQDHNGHYMLTQKIQFDLYRPLAKLSVYAAKVQEATTNPLISKIDYLVGGTRQYNYLFEQSDDVLNAIPTRANNRNLLSSNVSVTNGISSGSEEAKDPANYTEIAVGTYVAEVANGATAWDTPSDHDNAAVLRIEYAAGQGEQIRNAYVYLPALQRNHHVKVCILINAEGQLIINYEVADWEDNEMQDYSFDYPTHSYLRESIPTGIAGDAASPSVAAKMTETIPFTGYFQMTLPANDAWTPTLLGLKGADCDIHVYEANTSIEVTQFPIPASDKWYRIEVWPSGNKMAVGDETMLAISYTASGLTESEFLLINGSKDSYYWPYAGSSPQDPNYVIITMGN